MFELVLACGTGGGSLRWTYASGALRAEANGLFDDILLLILVSSYPYIPMRYSMDVVGCLLEYGKILYLESTTVVDKQAKVVF